MSPKTKPDPWKITLKEGMKLRSLDRVNARITKNGIVTIERSSDPDCAFQLVEEPQYRFSETTTKELWEVVRPSPLPFGVGDPVRPLPANYDRNDYVQKSLTDRTYVVQKIHRDVAVVLHGGERWYAPDRFELVGKSATAAGRFEDLEVGDLFYRRTNSDMIYVKTAKSRFCRDYRDLYAAISYEDTSRALREKLSLMEGQAAGSLGVQPLPKAPPPSSGREILQQLMETSLEKGELTADDILGDLKAILQNFVRRDSK